MIGVAEGHLASGFVPREREAADDLCEERVGQVGDDDADGVAFLLLESASELIGVIAHVVDGALHTGARGVGHPVGAVDDGGDGGDGDVASLRDVVERSVSRRGGRRPRRSGHGG